METCAPLVECASKLEPRPVTWLWPGRLARGKLSVIDGDPEIGKSLITLDLCARITTGQSFPDGAAAIPPSNVLILNGEDGAEDTVVPRLRGLGADLDRVFILRKELPDKAEPFQLPTHTDYLDRAMAETGAVFAVLDPVVAFLGASTNVAGDISVRRVLRPLAQICARHGCHTAMVRHLNKSGGFHAMYRGGGSIGLVASCRSAFLCARAPHDPCSVFAHIKNNLGPRQASLSYRIEAGPSGLPVLEWLGEHPLSADQLLTAAGLKPRLPSPRVRAQEFLTAFLEDGPRSTHDIWQAAQEQDLNKRTLQRVSRTMKLRSQLHISEGRRLTYWLLPGQKLPGEEAAAPTGEDGGPSLEEMLAELEHQYPLDPLEIVRKGG
jgi:hypothetical protein